MTFGYRIVPSPTKPLVPRVFEGGTLNVVSVGFGYVV